MEQYKISTLCRKYGFSYVDVGLYYRIKSGRDEWYIKKKKHPKQKIELKHDSTGWQNKTHLQGYFSSLDKVFRYIYKHDWRELENVL